MKCERPGCEGRFDQGSRNQKYCPGECRREMKLEHTRKSNERAEKRAKRLKGVTV